MTSIRHVGIVVQNIERQVEFYTGVFGFHILAQNTEFGEYISKLVGVSNTILKWVKLASCDNSVLLEFLHYETHDCACIESFPFTHGLSHIALTVIDIEKSLERLKEAGGRAGEYLYNPEKTVKVAYAYDPENIILELVQDL